MLHLPGRAEEVERSGGSAAALATALENDVQLLAAYADELVARWEAILGLAGRAVLEQQPLAGDMAVESVLPPTGTWSRARTLPPPLCRGRAGAVHGPCRRELTAGLGMAGEEEPAPSAPAPSAVVVVPSQASVAADSATPKPPSRPRTRETESRLASRHRRRRTAMPLVVESSLRRLIRRSGQYALPCLWATHCALVGWGLDDRSVVGLYCTLLVHVQSHWVFVVSVRR